MDTDYCKLLPQRDESGNKGTFGKVTVIAGSRGMAGAAYFCALAVLRSGAGMVRIFTPEANRIILQTLLPEAILSVYEDDADPCRTLIKALDWCDCAVAGPGLGISDQSLRLLETLFEYRKEKPIILDADAINLVARNKICIPKNCCLTPHVMEMSRLSGIPVDLIKSEPEKTASEFAARNSCVLVLKDHETVISSPDGRTFINTSGSSALAKAGTGDVLSGIIAGFTAQNGKLIDSAVLGAYIHGRSGEICAEKLTRYGVLSREVADNVPHAIGELLNS